MRGPQARAAIESFTGAGPQEPAARGLSGPVQRALSTAPRLADCHCAKSHQLVGQSASVCPRLPPLRGDGEELELGRVPPTDSLSVAALEMPSLGSGELASLTLDMCLGAGREAALHGRARVRSPAPPKEQANRVLLLLNDAPPAGRARCVHCFNAEAPAAPAH